RPSSSPTSQAPAPPASLSPPKPTSQPPPPAPASQTTPAHAEAGAAPEPFDALELRTFVVPQSAITMQASAEQKLALVRARFARRLPCPVERVYRVDVHAFEAGLLALLVWCPLD
ncbi:MAG TPA: hypothetical protein VFS00_14240, partial [Polyangiaceae bacterium]|nr:hypothetical protein [Polyangiaceae bacterium]